MTVDPHDHRPDGPTDILAAVAAADSPEAALDAALYAIADQAGSAAVVLVEPDGPDTATICAATSAEIVGQSVRMGAWRQLAAALDLSTENCQFVQVHDLTAMCFGGSRLTAERKALVTALTALAAQAIGQQRQAADASLWSAVISGSSSGFAIADATSPDLPLVYVNASFERVTGYRSAEVIGKNCRFLTAEASDSPERTRLREAVKKRTGGQFLLRNRRKSGEMFWNELTLYPVHAPDGALRNLVATQTDVTERVDAEALHDQARIRLEGALAATEDAFLILDAASTVVYANGAVGQLFPAPGVDWATGSLFGANWAAYLAESRDMPGRTTSLLREPDLPGLAKLPSGREIDLPDGRSILLRSGRLPDGGLVVSATDVTPMKSAQRLLSQRLAAIEAVADGIAVTDRAGRLIYLNAGAAALLGQRSAASGLGQKWYRRYRETTAVPESAPFTVTLHIDKPGPDGTGIEEVHEISASLLDTGGSVIVIRDISGALATEAREAELMQELIRLQRQEAVAQITAGVAHDFNNLLSAINGSATLIGLDDALPEAVRPHLERIALAGVQSARLVNRLLDIGAGNETGGSFGLSSVLSELPALLRASLPSNIDFSIASNIGQYVMRGNPDTLSQILINLTLNARDAIGMRPGAISLDAQPAVEIPTLSAGDPDQGARLLRIDLKDDGAGMDADTAANAFKAYFTTKGRKGTGLGLATVAMQLQAMGGGVSLDSQPGHGTTLSLFWPLAETRGQAAPASGAAVQDLSGMTVIVVDDDLTVGAVIGDYLEACGAEVAVCVDPTDVVSAVRDDPQAWSAVVTDYDMPQINGGALTADIRSVVPGLPVVVVTALARRLSDPRLDDVHILAKPVDLAALAQVLADNRKGYNVS